MLNPPPTPGKLRALCLTGPTACGKSALAMALAERFPLEIISVDSALVYRGMDIGTAKPSAAERAAVPHHLIDIREPSQSYSAAEFVRDAERLMADIQSRGRLPLLVGGTLLYIKALFDGLDALPAADPALRQQLEQQAAERGWPALHAELARVDPASAARLPPGDSQRIQRALEVWHLTGQPLSALQQGPRQRRPDEQAKLVLYAIEPDDRAWLHQRMAQRLDAMFEQGLIDEVRALRARGDLHPNLPSMRCVGYRQTWQALEENRPMSWLREQALAATRQLGKRQLTWLRSLHHRRRLPTDPAPALDQLCQALRHQPS